MATLIQPSFQTEIFLWGGGGGVRPPLGGFSDVSRGGGEKKNPGAEKFPRGVARHAPTLAMGPYSASCLVNKVTPCSQNATQLVKRRRKRKQT